METHMQKPHVVLVAAALILGISHSALADSEHLNFCSDSLIKGAYGSLLQGSRPNAAGLNETIIGVVVRVYDGNGAVVQWDNVKGTNTPVVPDRYGTGTYHVNDDCTVDIIFQPAPGVTIHEHAVILDNGKELRSIVVSPQSNMVTAISRRM